MLMAIAKQMPCAGRMTGIHTDYLAARVDERPSGVAGIERGVRLDHAVDQPSAFRPHGASKRAHDAGSDRGLETERIADRDRELAGTDRIGIAQPCRNLVRRGYAHDGKIGIGVIADHAGSAARAVDQCHVDRGRPGHDMAVGNDESVGREQKTGATTAPFASRRARLDVHDSGRDSRSRRGHGGRVRIEKLAVVEVHRLRFAGPFRKRIAG
jgi:hypothetical protein